MKDPIDLAALLFGKLGPPEPVVEAMMALQLTPPTKAMFRISVGLALVAIAFYFLGVFGVPLPDYQPRIVHLAFWIAALAWLAMFTGVASKGI